MTLAEVPPPNIRVTVTLPVASAPEKVGLENSTVSTAVMRMENELNSVSLATSIAQMMVHFDS